MLLRRAAIRGFGASALSLPQELLPGALCCSGCLCSLCGGSGSVCGPRACAAPAACAPAACSCEPCAPVSCHPRHLPSAYRRCCHGCCRRPAALRRLAPPVRLRPPVRPRPGLRSGRLCRCGLLRALRSGELPSASPPLPPSLWLCSRELQRLHSGGLRLCWSGSGRPGQGDFAFGRARRPRAPSAPPAPPAPQGRASKTGLGPGTTRWFSSGECPGKDPSGLDLPC